MPPIEPFDLYMLYALGIGQIGLLVTALVQLAGIKARVDDHHRRLSQIEKEHK